MSLQVIDLIEQQEELDKKTKRLLYDLREDIIDHSQATLRLAYAIESRKNGRKKRNK